MPDNPTSIVTPPPFSKDEVMDELGVDPLLTDCESAELLHVTVSTFRLYVADNIVPPPVKLGGTSR